jgi:hypothetical protein
MAHLQSVAYEAAYGLAATVPRRSRFGLHGFGQAENRRRPHTAYMDSGQNAPDVGASFFLRVEKRYSPDFLCDSA